MTAIASTLAACGGSQDTTPIRVCPEFPGSAASSDGFTFVLTENVWPEHAPIPGNDAEAIVFGLAYPPLVDTDCEGNGIPGAAASWEADPEAKSWSFRMSPDAALADGTPLTAAEVREMWLDRRDPASLVAPWIWDHVEPSGLRVTGDGRLVIAAPNAYADLLHALTQPSLALGRGPFTPWPMGTRGTLSGEAAVNETKVDEILWKRGSRSSAAASEITFRVMENASPREVVEAGADAFFVRNREALEYLEGLDGYRVTPLPYSRLYVLLTTEPDIAKKIEPEDLEKLLPIAIGDARLPENADGYHTEAPKSRDKPKATDTRIVVPWWDRDARAIASQLSAIWREKSRRGYPVTLPKKHDEFYRHVQEGGDQLYVFPVYPILPSADLQRLHIMRSAPWLAERGGSIALFETRGHLVTREGLAGFASGYDGFPRLENVGWARRPLP